MAFLPSRSHVLLLALVPLAPALSARETSTVGAAIEAIEGAHAAVDAHLRVIATALGASASAATAGNASAAAAPEAAALGSGNVTGDKGWCIWPSSELARRLEVAAGVSGTDPDKDDTGYYTVDENGFHRSLFQDDVAQIIRWLAEQVQELRGDMLEQAQAYKPGLPHPKKPVVTDPLMPVEELKKLERAAELHAKSGDAAELLGEVHAMVHESEGDPVAAPAQPPPAKPTPKQKATVYDDFDVSADLRGPWRTRPEQVPLWTLADDDAWTDRVSKAILGNAGNDWTRLVKAASETNPDAEAGYQLEKKLLSAASSTATDKLGPGASSAQPSLLEESPPDLALGPDPSREPADERTSLLERMEAEPLHLLPGWR